MIQLELKNRNSPLRNPGAAWYSLAIDRIPVNATDGPGGYLGLGSLPPVAYSLHFASTPIVTQPGSQINSGTGLPIKDHYSIIDGVAYGAGECEESAQTFNGTKYTLIVDSGTNTNVFPPATAAPINALFDPPAVFIPDSNGTYTVDCDARPPSLGIKIGEETFYHNGEDLIIYQGPGEPCLSALEANTIFDGLNAGALNILGDAFLKHVVALFDVGNSEMKFAAREDD